MSDPSKITGYTAIDTGFFPNDADKYDVSQVIGIIISPPSLVYATRSATWLDIKTAILDFIPGGAGDLAGTLGVGNTTGEQSIESDNGDSMIAIFDGSTYVGYSDGGGLESNILMDGTQFLVTYSDGLTNSYLTISPTQYELLHSAGGEMAQILMDSGQILINHTLFITATSPGMEWSDTVNAIMSANATNFGYITGTGGEIIIGDTASGITTDSFVTRLVNVAAEEILLKHDVIINGEAPSFFYQDGTGTEIFADGTSLYLSVDAFNVRYLSIDGTDMTIAHDLKVNLNAPLFESIGNIRFSTNLGIDTIASGGPDVLKVGGTNADRIDYGNATSTNKFIGVVNYDSLTASTLGYLDASKNFVSLANAAGVLTNNGTGTLTWGAAGGTTFSDSTFRIQDNADATKQLAFEVSGVTTATTRTVTAVNYSGTIVLSNGALTTGRIPVASSAGLIDYATFLFDGTNLGIGATPQSLLTVSKQTTIQAPVSGSAAHYVGLDANPLRITFDTHNNASASGTALMFRRSRGTSTTPSALSTDDDMGSFNVRGYGATQYAAASTGLLSFKAGSAYTDTSNETYMQVYTTPAASVTAVERLRITGSGAMLLGIPTATGRIFDIKQDTAFMAFGSQVGATSEAAIYLRQSSPSSTNYALCSNGVGGTQLNGSSTSLSLRVANSEKFLITVNQLEFKPTAATSGTSNPILFTMPSSTGLTASTEVVGFNIATSTVQHATGALTTQRYAVINAPTYSFVAASTITNAATLAITGAPIAGTNATLTNSYSFWVQGGASQFDGNVKIGSGNTFQLGNAATTGLTAGVLSATTNASIVLYDSTGQAYRVPCII